MYWLSLFYVLRKTPNLATRNLSLDQPKQRMVLEIDALDHSIIQLWRHLEVEAQRISLIKQRGCGAFFKV